MTTKLTIDNFDLSHSVTFEQAQDVRQDFDNLLPPMQPIYGAITDTEEPFVFSKLEQLFGFKTIFHAFSFFKFPKSFGRIRFLFRFRMVSNICPDACLECIEETMQNDPDSEKEGKSLWECFEEIRQKEKLLKEIQLKIVSFQKS